MGKYSMAGQCQKCVNSKCWQGVARVGEDMARGVESLCCAVMRLHNPGQSQLTRLQGRGGGMGTGPKADKVADHWRADLVHLPPAND